MKKILISAFAIASLVLGFGVPISKTIMPEASSQARVETVQASAVATGNENFISKDWKDVIGASILATVNSIMFSDAETKPTGTEYVVGNGVYAYVNGSVLTFYAGHNLDVYSPVDSSFLFGLYDEAVGEANTASLQTGLTPQYFTFTDVFNTSLTENMSYMFYKSRDVITLNLSYFKTDNLNNMAFMFYGYEYQSKLQSVIFGGNFDTSKVTTMEGLFLWGVSMRTIDVSMFDTTNVTKMNSMFSVNWYVTTIDVSNFNTSNVVDMRSMFNYCNRLTTITGLENFDTSNVTDFSNFFRENRVITNFDISNFDTSSATNMSSMFINAYLIEELDLSHFDTSNVTNINSMFNGTRNLTSLNLSGWDLSNVYDATNALANSPNIDVLYLPENMGNTTLVTNSQIYNGEEAITVINQDLINNSNGVLITDGMFGVAFDLRLDGVKNPDGVYVKKSGNDIVITMPDIKQENKILIGWQQTINNPVMYSPNEEVTFTVADESLTLYAVWAEDYIDIVWQNGSSVYADAYNLAGDKITQFKSGDTIKLSSSADGGSFIGFSYSSGSLEFKDLGIGSLVNGKDELTLNIFNDEFFRNNIEGNQITLKANYVDTMKTVTVEKPAENSASVYINNLEVVLNDSEPNAAVKVSGTNAFKLDVVVSNYYSFSKLIVTTKWLESDVAESSQEFASVEEFNALNFVLWSDATIKVETTKNDYVLEKKAITIYGEEARSDLIQNAAGATVSVNVDGVIENFFARQDLQEFVFVEWRYSNGEVISTMADLSDVSNVSLNNMQNNVLTIYAVYSKRYLVEVAVADGVTEYEIEYLNQNNELIKEANVASVYVFEKETATITVNIGNKYQISYRSAGLLSSEIFGNSIVISADRNRSIEIEFELSNFRVTVENVNQDGVYLRGIVGNYYLFSTSGDTNAVEVDSTITVGISENQPSTEDVVFTKAYLKNENDEIKVIISESGSGTEFKLNGEYLDYTTLSVYGNSLTIYFEYTVQSSVVVDVNNDLFGSFDLQYQNSAGQWVPAVSGAKYNAGTMFRISASAQDHYIISNASGVDINKLSSYDEFELDGAKKEIYIGFEAIAYKTTINNANVKNGVVLELNELIKIGDTVTLTFDATSTHDVATWKIEGVSDLKVSGNTATFDVTKEFLNAYLKNGVIEINNEISTTMDVAVLGGIIGGSVGFVVAAIIIILLVLKSKKQKREKAELQARIDEFNRKFNIADTIKDLKKGK